jgi:hypothetical protein
MAEAKKPPAKVEPAAPTAEEVKQYLEWSRQIEKQNQFVVHSREIFEASVLVEADLGKKKELQAAEDKALEDKKAGAVIVLSELQRAAAEKEKALDNEFAAKKAGLVAEIGLQESKKAKLYDDIAQLVKQLEGIKQEKVKDEASVQPALAAAQKELKAFEDDAAKKKAVLEAELAGLQQAIRNLRGGIERLPTYAKEAQKEKEAR